MPPPDLTRYDSPLGPLRDKRTVDISTNDYEREEGFICQVGGAGALTYRTLHGAADQTDSGLTAGAVIGVGAVPVILKAVRSASTVTSIIVGII